MLRLSLPGSAVCLTLLGAAACGPRPTAAAAPTAVATDIAFMQGMIGHHRQALTMITLAEANEAGTALRTMAERMRISQQDEIALMVQWLQDYGAAVPDSSAAHDHGHAAMPGMLTAAQLDTLARARGATFDSLFLTYMITHHQGAITMVEQLFASPDGGQASDVFHYATEIAADQAAEIARMQQMLPTTAGSTPP